jgi:anthranilate phosphoribosyltransferase
VAATPLNWSALTEKLSSGLDLERDEIQGAMREILGGDSDIENVKAFLLALKNKGETSDEVGALIEVMYAHAGPITIAERAVDTVGTGGDGDTPSIFLQPRPSLQQLPEREL